MAKKAKDSGFNAKGFIISAFALLVIFGLNIFLLGYVYTNTMNNMSTISSEMNLVNSANGMMNGINREVVEIVADVGSTTGHMKAIEAQFKTINDKLDAYMSMPGHADSAVKRMQIARAYLNAYSTKLSTYREELNRKLALADSTEKEEYIKGLKEIYNQEVAPIATAAGQMLIATIQIATSAADVKSNQSIKMVYFLMALLAVILIICEIGVYFFARFSKRSVEEIEHKTKQVAEASGKLMRSREKMEQAVQTNFLTGFKNRYSLEQDINERLASEQFNIAAFDLDNFKSINDMYGYDFGDEYLVQIAERLKNEFSQCAEIYNITGNEFVFVFHREVSDSQAIRYVENIVSVMNAPYTIFNLTVQLTVSAASYHYLAGDCLNVNSLLVKLDNVIRNAKRAGGGQILPVADL